jgi:hypothetical protein
MSNAVTFWNYVAAYNEATWPVQAVMIVAVKTFWWE